MVGKWNHFREVFLVVNIHCDKWLLLLKKKKKQGVLKLQPCYVLPWLILKTEKSEKDRKFKIRRKAEVVRIQGDTERQSCFRKKKWWDYIKWKQLQWNNTTWAQEMIGWYQKSYLRIMLVMSMLYGLLQIHYNRRHWTLLLKK